MVVAGSAKAGTTMPPVNIVNEIAAPEATTTATARPVPTVMPDHLPRAAFVRLRISVTPKVRGLCVVLLSGLATGIAKCPRRASASLRNPSTWRFR